MKKLRIRENKKLLIILAITVSIVLSSILILLLHSKIFLSVNKISAEVTFHHNHKFFRQIYKLSLRYPFYSDEDENQLVKLSLRTVEKLIDIDNLRPNTSINTSLLQSGIKVNVHEKNGQAKTIEKFLVKNEVEKKSQNKFIKPVSLPRNSVTIIGTGDNQEIHDSLVEQVTSILESEFNGIPTLRSIRILELEEVNVKSEIINFAITQILFDQCNYFIEVPIGFHWQTQKYYLEGIGNIAQYACDTDIYGTFPDTVRMATCFDCTFYRIDKTTFLPADYIPSTKEFVNGQVHRSAYSDAVELYAASKEVGFKTNITSSYRSYERQQEVFKYWVDREKTLFGRSQQVAEASANTYSARPGFSEHQLGTTIDINSTKCTGFDGFCSSNEDLWDWLKDNAWKYGFIQSYPDGKQKETGYVGEDWHYRWLGREVAKEYIETSNGQTLNLWLEQKYLDSFAVQD